MMRPQPVPRPDWSALPIEGAVGIEGKVLLEPPPVLIAMLRFSKRGGFPAHAAPFDVDVVCLDGAGFVLVGEDSYPFRAGERVRWPANMMHRLWTDADEMTTLMVEHGSWLAESEAVRE
jgi:quercetin dioxygenase-like cupin family protein